MTAISNTTYGLFLAVHIAWKNEMPNKGDLLHLLYLKWEKGRQTCFVCSVFVKQTEL